MEEEEEKWERVVDPHQEHSKGRPFKQGKCSLRPHANNTNNTNKVSSSKWKEVCFFARREGKEEGKEGNEGNEEGEKEFCFLEGFKSLKKPLFTQSLHLFLHFSKLSSTKKNKALHSTIPQKGEEEEEEEETLQFFVPAQEGETVERVREGEEEEEEEEGRRVLSNLEMRGEEESEEDVANVGIDFGVSNNDEEEEGVMESGGGESRNGVHGNGNKLNNNFLLF